TKEELLKYGVIRGGDPKAVGRQTVEKAIAARVEGDAFWENFKRFLVFHENAISGPNIMRPPTTFSGQDYQFNEKEEETFKNFWNYAQNQAKAVRAIDPAIQIWLGNGTP